MPGRPRGTLTPSHSHPHTHTLTLTYTHTHTTGIRDFYLHRAQLEHKVPHEVPPPTGDEAPPITSDNGDIARIARLEDQLERSQDQCRKLERQVSLSPTLPLSHPTPPPPPPPLSLPLPPSPPLSLPLPPSLPPSYPPPLCR